MRDQRSRLPDISVVIVTPDHYDTIRQTIGHLRQQTAQDRLEIVIVAPGADLVAGHQCELDDFLQVRVVALGEVRSVAQGNAAGVRHASAPVVAFIEEHSYPDLGGMEALSRAHRQPWAAVGPVVRNANPGSAVSWADLLIAYGPWLEPVQAGIVGHLPGHNSSYKKEVLLSYGPDLEKMLEAETPMQWDLRSRGHRFCMEEKAKVFHLNYSRFLDSVSLRLNVGRLFACRRSDHWPLWKRWMFVLASPAIPVVRFFRLAPIAGRALPTAWLSCRVIPLLFLMLTIDGLREAIGYLTGSPGDAMRILSDGEFHRRRHLNRADLRQADAQDLAGLSG